jgi:hypothetical protein
MTLKEGDRVEYKIAILKLGCHQYQVAMAAGLHESKLSAFLSGRTGLNRAQLEKLQQVLGLEEVADVSA